jgi:hypothetical protein
MSEPLRRFRQLLATFSLLCIPLVAPASEWRTIGLPARPMNITENRGILWVCGADELIANSTDGGKTWTSPHSNKGGGILLAMGFASDQFGYAAGTSGAVLFTKDGGATWDRIKAPAQVIYGISFSDEKHGVVHTPQTITHTMPPYVESSSPIAPLLSPPALDAPPSQGVQCISCDVEKLIVTRDYQGIAEVDLKIHIGQNGLVEQAEIVHATKPEIGDRMAAAVRNWIFVPYEKDGVVHPVVTDIKLRVQAIKSK